MNKRCGSVCIVGRPNVGKSTLLNCLLGYKISITARKPQTTRQRILGIHTVGNNQAIYIDTPGIQRTAKHTLNRLMNRTAKHAIEEVDLILFMVEAKRYTNDDDLVATQLKNAQVPSILLINKIDRINDKSSLLTYMEKLSKKMNFSEIIPLSAEYGKNIDTVSKIVQRYLPIAEHRFPEQEITNHSSDFLIKETIREKIIRFFGAELPYVSAVELEKVTQHSTGTYEIHALILVDRHSQRKIVIGAKGNKIKSIGQAARVNLQQLLQNNVHLQLWVKVKSGWVDDQQALTQLGYSDR